MSKIENREDVIKYLIIKPNLDIAAARVINEKLDIDTIATTYGLHSIFLKQKVDILKRLNDYFEETLLYENAVRSVMYNHKTLLEAATYFKLSPEIITKEINQYNKLQKAGKTKGPYEYDNFLNEYRVFTFREELSLLDDLREWKWKSASPCTCLICAMVQLFTLAYQTAQQKNKLYPEMWDTYQQADKRWVIAFEMAHSCRFSKLYPHYNNNIQELDEACKNKKEFLQLRNESKFKIPINSTQYLRKRKNNNSLYIDKTKTTQTSQVTMSTTVQNHQNTNELKKILLDNFIKSKNEEETASASFLNDQFENTPAPLNLTLDKVEVASNNNILEKENIDPWQAYNADVKNNAVSMEIISNE